MHSRDLRLEQTAEEASDFVWELGLLLTAFPST